MTTSSGCEGAPLLPLLYIASNIFFSISILNLLKVSNAIVASLASRAAGTDAYACVDLVIEWLMLETKGFGFESTITQHGR